MIRKTLFLLLSCFFLLPSGAAMADDPYKPKIRVYAPAETAKDTKAPTAEDLKKEHKTPEEQIWAKYRTLASGAENTPGDKPPENSEIKEEQSRDEQTGQVKNNQISEILKQYTSGQSDGSKMNSRSFPVYEEREQEPKQK